MQEKTAFTAIVTQLNYMVIKYWKISLKPHVNSKFNLDLECYNLS
jgi:hypothetical protein